MTSIETLPDDPALSPRLIAEHILQETGRGIEEDRFDLVLPHVSVPFRIETFGESREIESEDALRELFRAVRRFFSNIGVTHVDRFCVEAEASGPDRISFTHETRLLSGARLLQEPYPVYTDAVRTDGRWQITRTSLAIVDQDQFVNALLGKG